jgi:hypothetical protein
MPDEQGREGPNEPERLPLRWALIFMVGILAGIGVDTTGHPALAIGTVAAVALALHQILR